MADLLVHIGLGQCDFLPGRHEDIIQLHAVRLDLFAHLFEGLRAIFARLQILRQRSIRRTGTAPAPLGCRSAAQFKMNRVDAECIKITQMFVVEVTD